MITRCITILISIMFFMAVLQDAAAGKIAMVESFNCPKGLLPEGWETVAGNCKIENSGLILDAPKSLSCTTFGESCWQNYEIQATATFQEVDGSNAWLGVVFRAASNGTAGSMCLLRFESKTPKGFTFASFDNLNTPNKTPEFRTIKKVELSQNCQINKPQKIRIRVVGTDVWAYLDGELIMNNHYCIGRETGRLGLAAHGGTVRFDDVQVRALPPSARLSSLAPQKCEIVAHRGFSTMAPENTLSSIRAAIEAGATACEFDVHRSRDGAVVLLHDETVDRTTNGTGTVTEMTLSQLKQLDVGSWKDARFTGERIATLEEALALFKTADCIPVIEIKMQGISQKVVDAVRKAGMTDRAAVIAFDKTVVEEIRGLEPKLACAWLYGKTLSGTPLQQAKWIADEAASCKTKMVDLNSQILSNEIIAELHRRGICIWCWTVDSPAYMDALMRWQVDGITTNRPDRLVPLVERAR